MALILASILFGVFVINVVMGALMNNGFLTDVMEMLLLFAASILFVAAILKREAAQKKTRKNKAQ